MLLRQAPRAGSGLVRPESPLIIAGMHRSGTSIITELLEQGGMDVGGANVDEHQEWTQFSRANRAMIGEGTFLVHDFGWTAPKTAAFIEARCGYAEAVARWAGRSLSRRGSPSAWGWKDPRNCLTLPVWLAIYPNARVLHIVRDERAAALSLADRDHLDPDFGLTLWALYSERLEAAMASLPAERRHTVRYEDVMSRPEETLHVLFRFAGLATQRLDRIASAIDPSRVGARREDPRTAKLAGHPLLERYGYSPEPTFTQRSSAVNAR
jgi:hypothetical protein